MTNLDEQTRADWGCAYMAPSKREGVFPVPHDWGIEPTVCPGFAMQRPEVLETIRASWWMNRGHLNERYQDEGLSPQLLDCIEIYEVERERAQSQYNQKKIEARKEKKKQGGNRSNR